MDIKKKQDWKFVLCREHKISKYDECDRKMDRNNAVVRIMMMSTLIMMLIILYKMSRVRSQTLPLNDKQAGEGSSRR